MKIPILRRVQSPLTPSWDSSSKRGRVSAIFQRRALGEDFYRQMWHNSQNDTSKKHRWATWKSINLTGCVRRIGPRRRWRLGVGMSFVNCQKKRWGSQGLVIGWIMQVQTSPTWDSPFSRQWQCWSLPSTLFYSAELCFHHIKATQKDADNQKTKRETRKRRERRRTTMVSWRVRLQAALVSY